MDSNISSKHSTFQRVVLNFYKNHGRHNLPWRKTTDPYKILVSEVMLQQTQVDRVVPYYKAFLKKFPTARRLAEAKLSSVLRAWQGLGYNRRAKMLHDAAKKIITYDTFPRTHSELITWPGVGEYTANAIRIFAFNEPETLIETNIRSALLHHFFSRKKNIHDQQLLQLTVTPKGISPKQWYWALMDYGAYLKKTVPNPSRRSAHHTRQKPFKGSDREIRGAILRKLAEKSATEKEILALPFSKPRIKKQLAALIQESLIVRGRKGITLAN